MTRCLLRINVLVELVERGVRQDWSEPMIRNQCRKATGLELVEGVNAAFLDGLIKGVQIGKESKC